MHCGHQDVETPFLLFRVTCSWLGYHDCRFIASTVQVLCIVFTCLPSHSSTHLCAHTYIHTVKLRQSNLLRRSNLRDAHHYEHTRVMALHIAMHVSRVHWVVCMSDWDVYCMCIPYTSQHYPCSIPLLSCILLYIADACSTM